jgi:predicted nucleic acid-binding protein
VSQLAEVEVARGLRSRLDVDIEPTDFAEALDQVFDGVALYPVDGQVVGTAQIIGPAVLRSLDAIHLATAALLRVDLLVSYDERMLEVAAGLGILTERP